MPPSDQASAPTPLPERIRLVVLFGGRSAEHDISRVSASHVLRAVDPERYEVVPVGITRDGEWRHASAAAELLARGRAQELAASIEIDGPSTDRDGALATTTSSDPPTVVLPILHGPNGEDGTIQGLLEIAGVPYVGAGVLGSAVAMDKAMAKTVLAAHGIAQPRWRELRPADLDRDPAGLAGTLLEELGPTVFVKPANMGSSIGVARVEERDALHAALAEAFRFDDIAVVEAGVDARELECAVLGNDASGDHAPRTSCVGEIVPGADFYDFDDKYAAGVARTVIPADLPETTAEAARALALAVYRALRAEGMARVDLFLTRDGDLLVNEINTIPGFTPISMYPMLWAASGLGYGELIDELVRLALERHDRRRRHATSPAGGET